jgi:hypothetical protein
MKAFNMEMIRSLRERKRNLKHVASLRSGKQHEKIKLISDPTLVSAIKWLGHAVVCRIISESANQGDVLEGISRGYALQ